MGAATKRRRRIIINDRLFLWYVRGDEAKVYQRQDPYPVLLYIVLHIVSEDKHFNVQYLTNQCLLQPPYIPNVLVVGREFPGLTKSAGWQRVAAPRWEDDSVSPRLVR